MPGFANATGANSAAQTSALAKPVLQAEAWDAKAVIETLLGLSLATRLALVASA
jgi:hypothetical protein